MNRTLMFGIATFFAIVGLALTGGEKEVQAGLRCGGRAIGCNGGGHGCGGARACGGGHRCGGRLFSRLHRNRCGGERVNCCGEQVAPEPACPPKCGGCAGSCHGGLFARLRARRAARRCCGPVNDCCGPVNHCEPAACPPAPSCCGNGSAVVAPADAGGDAVPVEDAVPAVPAAPAPDAA